MPIVSLHPMRNTMPCTSEPSFFPISTDTRTKMKNETFTTPLHVDNNSPTLTSLSLSQDEQVLLHWHCVFGHVCIRKIRQIIENSLWRSNLPTSLPKGNVKCNICAHSKSIMRPLLLTSGRTLGKLDVAMADVVGPFEVETFNQGKYLLTLRDVGTGYSEAKVLVTKDQSFQMLIDTIN